MSESLAEHVLLIFEAESIEAVCEILGCDVFLSEEEVLRASPVCFRPSPTGSVTCY